mgnify:CR=1 FL=1
MQERVFKVNINGVPQEIILKHNQFIAKLRETKGEYEAFLSDLDYLRRGHDLENVTELEMKNGVYYPIDPPRVSNIKKYIQEVADLKTYYKLAK